MRCYKLSVTQVQDKILELVSVWIKELLELVTAGHDGGGPEFGNVHSSMPCTFVRAFSASGYQSSSFSSGYPPGYLSNLGLWGASWFLSASCGEGSLQYCKGSRSSWTLASLGWQRQSEGDPISGKVIYLRYLVTCKTSLLAFLQCKPVVSAGEELAHIWMYVSSVI